jgi:sortase A
MRRPLRALSTVLIVSGSLLILDAGLTLVWQEPVSAVYARFTQRALAGQLDDQSLNQTQLRALARLRTEQKRIAFLARAARRDAKPGDALGRIKIKKIGISFVAVEGTDAADLRKGPGHYPETPLPGIRGTVAIAGHRTTYLAPFRNIDKIKRGNQIVLEMPYGRFIYRAERTRIVAPTEYSVIKRTSYDRLVLTACHPLYSAKQRIVVFARLVGVQARGKARLTPSPRPRATPSGVRTP